MTLSLENLAYFGGGALLPTGSFPKCPKTFTVDQAEVGSKELHQGLPCGERQSPAAFQDVCWQEAGTTSAAGT